MAVKATAALKRLTLHDATSMVYGRVLLDSRCTSSMAGVDPTLIWKTTVPGWMFSVGPENGFMPRQRPLLELPAQFADLDTILKDMPIELPGNRQGLLATGGLRDAVLKRLTLHDVTSVLQDNRLTTALFRDYSVLASAYLLEPSHLYMMATGKYGEARDHLPASIAVPLCKLAKHLDTFPFLDYAQAYALNNWSKVDESKPMDWKNIQTFRKFQGGVDEQGFIIVHIAMANHTRKQVTAAQEVILGAGTGNIDRLTDGLNAHADFLKQILEVFVDMWNASSPKKYLGFRTFIMGITGNSDIFPRGVLYEGVDKIPKSFRGETGAQDSIIPSTDNLLQMSYPQNKLVEYLMELRDYRPKDHRAYVEWVKQAAIKAAVKDTAHSTSRSSLALLRNLDFVQQMRSQHWSMTKQYIIKNTKHPKATGGTPITTWLPNNLGSTLEYMEQTCARIKSLQASGDNLSKVDAETFAFIEAGLQTKIDFLRKEVTMLQADFEQQEANEFSKRARSASCSN